MATKKASSVMQEQEPPLDRCRSVPVESWLSDRASTIDAYGTNPYQGAALPSSSAGAPPRSGIHLAAGGARDEPNSRSLLPAALAACFDSISPMHCQTTNQKGLPMRFLHTTTTFAVALLSLNVYAQQSDSPRRTVSTEPASSVFVYEAIGATPSIRTPKWLQSRAARTPDKATARAAASTPTESAASADASEQRVVKDARAQVRVQ